MAVVGDRDDARQAPLRNHRQGEGAGWNAHRQESLRPPPPRPPAPPPRRRPPSVTIVREMAVSKPYCSKVSPARATSSSACAPSAGVTGLHHSSPQPSWLGSIAAGGGKRLRQYVLASG